MRTHTHKTGLAILRLGLAAVFLWFGYSQLTDAANWIFWVPTWATSISHVSASTIVFLNGVLEVAGGILLAINFFTRWAALVLFAHLAIITLDIGLSAVGVRDFGLTMATLALFFLSHKDAR